MLVLILDRTAAIERIVTLATEPPVPEQFMLRAPVDDRGASHPMWSAPLVIRTLDVRDLEPVLTSAYHVGPLW